MIKIEFSIWLASKTRWVHLTKIIEMQAVPRSGEYMKFRNNVVGDYFSFKVTEVVYRETGSKIEISTELLDNIDNRGYSFEDESEFDEYLSSYLSAGWLSPHGVTENKRIGRSNA